MDNTFYSTRVRVEQTSHPTIPMWRVVFEITDRTSDEVSEIYCSPGLDRARAIQNAIENINAALDYVEMGKYPTIGTDELDEPLMVPFAEERLAITWMSGEREIAIERARREGRKILRSAREMVEAL